MNLGKFLNDNKITVLISLLIFLMVVAVAIYLVKQRDKGLTKSSKVKFEDESLEGTDMYQYEDMENEDSENEEDVEVVEDFATTKQPVKIVLFFAPWCPHCQRFMDGEESIWEQLKRKHGNRADRKFIQVNGDKQPDVAQKFGVGGFPTILKMMGDKIQQFDGERTLPALEAFMDNN